MIPFSPDLIQGAFAFAGSAVGLKWSPGNILARFGNWAIGGVLGFALGPWLAEIFTVSSQAGRLGVSFSVGMCGIFVLAKVVESIQAVDAKEVALAVVGWIKRILGISQS